MATNSVKKSNVQASHEAKCVKILRGKSCKHTSFISFETATTAGKMDEY